MRDGMTSSIGTFSSLWTVAEGSHNGKMGISSSLITYLGRTTFRNWGIPFGIKESDRLYHMYVIGRTGTGKSTLLDQLEPGIRDAVLGNVGTLVSFRLGPKDASLIAKEFDPCGGRYDLPSDLDAGTDRTGTAHDHRALLSLGYGAPVAHVAVDLDPTLTFPCRVFSYLSAARGGRKT